MIRNAPPDLTARIVDVTNRFDQLNVAQASRTQVRRGRVPIDGSVSSTGLGETDSAFFAHDIQT